MDTYTWKSFSETRLNPIKEVKMSEASVQVDRAAPGPFAWAFHAIPLHRSLTSPWGGGSQAPGNHGPAAQVLKAPRKHHQAERKFQPRETQRGENSHRDKNNNKMLFLTLQTPAVPGTRGSEVSGMGAGKPASSPARQLDPKGTVPRDGPFGVKFFPK